MTDERRHIRTGFRTVTPYLTVQGAAGLIDFLVATFGAEEIRRDHRGDGSLMNAELRLVDSIIELGEARAPWPPHPGALHIYVPDTDESYRRALDAGATSIYEPAEMPYGERSAGVRDQAGNVWYIATFHGE